MRPFKMFFGLSLAIMLLLFVAKFFVFAFIAAAVMSIVYAIFRRLKDFITYDRYGDPYLRTYESRPGLSHHRSTQVEPLFHGSTSHYQHRNEDIRFIEAT